MPKIIISSFSSDDAQVLADAACCYQTSMGPQFVLAGIPTFQIGHETYEDILVKHHLADSVTNAEQLKQEVGSLKDNKTISRKDLLDGLGIKENWTTRLECIIKQLFESVYS